MRNIEQTFTYTLEIFIQKNDYFDNTKNHRFFVSISETPYTKPWVTITIAIVIVNQSSAVQDRPNGRTVSWKSVNIFKGYDSLIFNADLDDIKTRIKRRLLVLNCLEMAEESELALSLVRRTVNVCQFVFVLIVVDHWNDVYEN